MNSTIRISALPALSDNYIWLLDNGSDALCIDPGLADAVLPFLQQHGLRLSQIWITHPHHDHIGGIAGLKQQFPDCSVAAYDDVAHADEYVDGHSRLTWQGVEAEVWHVPGHCAGHIAFILRIETQTHAFVGDTLFSAGCGRVFPDSKPEWLFDSVQRLNTLPDDTLIYPAHEYTASNLRFAQHIEPENPHIAAALEQARHTPTLPVRLADERRINPFLRTDNAKLRARTEALCGQALPSEQEVFIALRELKNRF